MNKNDLKIDYLGQKPPSIEPVIFAPGMISMKGYREYGGHFSPDGMEFYFTRYRPGFPGVIMFSSFKNGAWTLPDTVSFMHEFPGTESCFSPNGSQFFYVWHDDQSGEFIHDLYVVDRSDTGWLEPRALTDTDLGERRISPSVAKSHNVYYSGNLDKPEDKDIYVCYYKNGRYTAPINLGPTVNSDYYEEHVYVSPDESYILFDSYKPDGSGGSDLYVSFRNTDGSWSKAQNLGRPVNTEFYDWYPNVTPDGKYLIFARSTEDEVDLYWCSADIDIIEKLKKCEL